MPKQKSGARNLEKEIKELRIVAIEDYGVGSLESTFAAFDAIREYEKQTLKKEAPRKKVAAKTVRSRKV